MYWKSQLTFIACTALFSAACGDDSTPTDTGTPDTGTGDTSTPDTSTPDTSTPDTSTPDAGGVVMFDVHVVTQSPAGIAGVPQAYVRVDDALGGTRTVMTDDDGMVTLDLPEGSEPWTVTAAKPDFTIISILGVTGPLSAPIHFGGPGVRTVLPEDGHERPIGGAITGRTLTDVDTVFLNGWVYDPSIDLTANTYTGTFPDWPGAPDLRLLAVEWQDGPVNAVWLDVARDMVGTMADVDIAFPTPARTVQTSAMTLNLPTDGAIDANGFEVRNDPAPVAFHREGLGNYAVGLGSTATVADGTTAWSIDHFEGDLAPTYAVVDLGLPSPPSGAFHHVQVAADIMDGATIDVPSADRVEAMGTPLVDMTVSVDASAYEHAGASILGNGDGWFIYSYTAATWIDQPWPELPEGLDIDGFFDTAAGQNHHAFCLTYDESREPWNWSEYEGLRALLESTVLPPPAP